MIFLWIIVAIIVFSIIILVHEFWHFKSARIFWVKVEEFWLWIPPRAKKIWKDKHWTIYSLNWLPLWWFVRLTWENQIRLLIYNKEWEIYNNNQLEKDIKKDKDIFNERWDKLTKIEKEEILKKLEENNAPYNLSNKPARQQSIIVVAWAFMNFLFAIVIFSILFFIWIKPIWINDNIQTNQQIKTLPTLEQAYEVWLLIKWRWVVLYPLKDSIAEKSWIMQWDIVTWINIGKFSLLTNEDNVNSFIETIKKSKQKNLTFIIIRDNETLFKEITPSEEWKIWSYIWENIKINKDFKYKYWPLESIKYWTLETYNYSILTIQWLWTLWRKIFSPKTKTERKEAINQISWPIWIVDFISNSIWAWITFLTIFSAIISLSLWVFNLLPIPALDWWRFLFIVINVIIQKISWKKWISPLAESMIHASFFILLIILSALIAYNDIIKIINNGQTHGFAPTKNLP